MPFPFLREPVAGLTHLLAALLALAGLRYLCRRSRGDRVLLVSAVVFGGSMALLYLASAAYHLVDAPPPVVRTLRQLDHAAIYVLIAGTFTPIGTQLLDGVARVVTLVGIWFAGTMGVALKLAYFDMPQALSTSLYLAMGWVGVLLYARVRRRVSSRALAWMLAGGVLYSAGALLDLSDWPTLLPGVVGSHELFHVFVMGGSAAHFAFIARHVIPNGSGAKGSWL